MDIHKSFEFVVLTPPGSIEPSLAIAASRAGGIGVLDLEYAQNEQTALAAVDRLARFAKGRCGLKVDIENYSLFAKITDHLPSQIKFIILNATVSQRLAECVEVLRNQSVTILLESTCLEEARLGEAFQLDGLIAKGHDAGGRVGEETTFVLMQHLMAQIPLPVWAHGGIGLHTAPACFAAGAAGAVLDAQLYLTRESTLPKSAQSTIARMDGSETLCLSLGGDKRYRMYYRPGLSGVEGLQRDLSLADRKNSSARQIIKTRIGWENVDTEIWLLGQDAAFAKSLTQRFETVGGILTGLQSAVDHHIEAAIALRPLSEDAPLAHVHRTRFPIVQGPMTRVSDQVDFADEVSRHGALPFLALALMRAPELHELLQKSQERMGERPWGVGILGFVPIDLREEQIEAIQAYHPPFALIAGGRPDQALSLEEKGISTYIHVPSPGLLKLFLENGARKFVFEGRECGGHVGPRSSFVLWNSMIDTLLESLSPTELSNCHILFAGGIHDSISSSMVAVMSAPLAQHGAKIGVLLGTAYLFTKEAVKTGAIMAGFQQAALQCQHTVLLETGPGHSTRCADTPYTKVFENEKQRLHLNGVPNQEIQSALENLNLGRLRIASKGIARHSGYGINAEVSKYIALDEEQQALQGMFMIGQVAVLRDSVCTLEELHREVSINGTARLSTLTELKLSGLDLELQGQPCDIAIIGMSCLLPKAPNLHVYWENILNKVDAITEVPVERWDWRLYYDPDPKTPDKVYSKWGGFLDNIPFDPLQYGMPPSSLPSIEPLQLLMLEAVRAALDDAGYSKREFVRERTAVILGVGGGNADLGQKYALRSQLPQLPSPLSSEAFSRLPEWTEDSFAGILLNVTAGRVANRFDLGGVNYTVDAACASSLAAVYLATRELESKASDMVIVGGGDTVQNPFGYLCFSKTHALSPRGRCRTFDDSADGIVISEGVAVLVLKRLADAERDGDRIYAVIKGVAGSSDGRDKSLTAPRPEGQALALQRAYAQAGFSPATVGLIEAHGTGTVAGDQAEIQTLKRVFESAGALRESCAIGSVKSMIGHTKCTAGVAGLMKATMALYHKILPPTLHIEKPNQKANFPESPFYVNTDSRPWWRSNEDPPRRAGVSAFGFGGTNFHAVLEEYSESFIDSIDPSLSMEWPGELLLWNGNSHEELLSTIESLQQALDRGAQPALADLSFSLWQQAREKSGLKLAIIATSLKDLQKKLVTTRDLLKSGNFVPVHDPRGIYLANEPLARQGKIAFLFPGQGSQYPVMLNELVMRFPEVRKQFELADKTLKNSLLKRLSSYIFPPPYFSQDERRAYQEQLTQTNIAQPALGAAGMALVHLLQAVGIQPDMVAGHSYGEYVALCSAGVFTEEVLYMLSERRGRCIMDTASQDLGTMASVAQDRAQISPVLSTITGVWIANINSPRQTVISGTRQGIEEVTQHLIEQGIQVRSIPVACAFHSPLIAAAQDCLNTFLSTLTFAPPRVKVFSNTTGAAYPEEPNRIVDSLSRHLVHPVKFMEEVQAMFDSGARIFIEVGPRSVLTGLVGQILAEQPHLAIPMDMDGRNGLLQLLHVLAQLATHAVSFNLDRLFKGRVVRQLDLARLEEQTSAVTLTSTTWLVNGGAAIPLRKANQPKAHQEVLSEQLPPVNRSGQVLNDSVTPRTSNPPPQQSEEFPQRAENTSPSLISVERQSNHEVDQVMMQFQHLMDRFLETQQQVMLAFLQNENSASIPLNDISQMLQRPETLPQISTDSISAKQNALNPLDQPSSSEADKLLVASGATTLQTGDSTAKDSRAVLEAGHLIKQLLQIVHDRTGYPPEMLDVDANMEADLGIDSIKRVEILGVFQSTCLPVDPVKTKQLTEQLPEIKTLQGIVEAACAIFVNSPGDKSTSTLSQNTLESTVSAKENNSESWMDRSQDGQKVSVKPMQTVNTGPANGKHEPDQEVPRLIQRAVEAPLPANSNPLLARPTDGVFLITDDEHGTAEIVAQGLRQRGMRVCMVKLDKQNEQIHPELFHADLTEPRAVSMLCESIRNQLGHIMGVIHLLPLKEGLPLEELDILGWQYRLQTEIKSIFHLAREVSADFKQIRDPGKSWLISATRMGGWFGIAQQPETFFPGQAGLTGFIKSIALEWPYVNCKAIDFDPQDSITTWAEHILREITDGDPSVEIGYRGTKRFVLQPKPTPVDRNGTSLHALSANSVVLITGGGRGITAEVACELAARYQPTLLIVGRSPFPEQESIETAKFTSPHSLKAAIIDQIKQKSQQISVTQVEAVYSQLLHDRETCRNLKTMQDFGATVRYYQVDVRNELAFATFIDEIYDTYGRLDAVLHGAGVTEDKLIEDKSPESFDRVFDTKTKSAFILSQKLRADSLRYLVFFSSVAGCFGNRGQSDYGAANEVLNKLANYLDHHWAGRIVSINWGPWAQIGMVSAEIEKQFAQRGVQLISPTMGCQLMDQELMYGQKGESEVILGGGPWSLPATKDESRSKTSFPLLDGQRLAVTKNGSFEMTYWLNPVEHLYLQDHKLDQKSVLPATMAMELMAEAVLGNWPDWQLVGIQSLRVLNGIILNDHESRELRIVAQLQSTAPPVESNLNVQVEIRSPDQASRVCYRAIVRLTRKNSYPRLPKFPEIMDMHEFPMSNEEIYRSLLFHGPRFQCVSEIKGINDQGIIATLVRTSPKQCLANTSTAEWLIDPVILDGGPQLAILWARSHWDMTALPTSIGDYYRYRVPSSSLLNCYLEVLPSSQDHTLHSNVYFAEPNGQLIAMINDLEATCSRELNRLTGSRMDSAQGNI